MHVPPQGSALAEKYAQKLYHKSPFNLDLVVFLLSPKKLQKPFYSTFTTTRAFLVKADLFRIRLNPEMV